MAFFKKNLTVNGAPEHSRHSYHRRSIIWMLLAILVITMGSLGGEGLWENGFYKGLFPLFRVVYDYSLGWSPVPMIYLVVAWLVYRTFTWAKQRQKGLWFQLTRAVGGIAAMITFFYVLWGFNYGQENFHQRIGLSDLHMTAEAMEREFKQATDELRRSAEMLPENLRSDEALKHRKFTDDQIRGDLKKALQVLQLPQTGRVRVRQLFPKGFLMRWSTAGIYIPQTGEGHIDAGLLGIQKPYTMAHEMAHGYGITDEGACNFMAWLACNQSNDPWIRFGGDLSYWRTAASQMPDSVVRITLQELPPVVRRALELIHANNNRYPDILPGLRNAVYASYLKRHGIKSGLRSYSEVVVMVEHYRNTNSSLQLRE